jgi:hypothetical protein
MDALLAGLAGLGVVAIFLLNILLYSLPFVAIYYVGKLLIDYNNKKKNE